MENKKLLTGKTFTPSYDEIEDRIRLIINYQDLNNRTDFVITRNMIINLIPIVDEYINKYYVDYLDDFKPMIDIDTKIERPKENVKLKNNTSPLITTDTSDIELLKTKDLLLYKIDLTYNKNSKNTTLLLSSKDITIKSILDAQTLQHIFKTIKDSVPNFKWGLSKSFLYS